MIVYKDKQPIISFILNCSTGEIGIAIKGFGARVIRTNHFLGKVERYSLPYELPLDSSKSIAMHAQPTDIDILQNLYKLWEKKIRHSFLA